jgi:hypothetical protein
MLHIRRSFQLSVCACSFECHKIRVSFLNASRLPIPNRADPPRRVRPVRKRDPRAHGGTPRGCRAELWIGAWYVQRNPEGAALRPRTRARLVMPRRHPPLGESRPRQPSRGRLSRAAYSLFVLTRIVLALQHYYRAAGRAMGFLPPIWLRDAMYGLARKRDSASPRALFESAGWIRRRQR